MLAIAQTFKHIPQKLDTLTISVLADEAIHQIDNGRLVMSYKESYKFYCYSIDKTKSLREVFENNKKCNVGLLSGLFKVGVEKSFFEMSGKSFANMLPTGTSGIMMQSKLVGLLGKRDVTLADTVYRTMHPEKRQEGTEAVQYYRSLLGVDCNNPEILAKTLLSIWKAGYVEGLYNPEVFGDRYTFLNDTYEDKETIMSL